MTPPKLTDAQKAKLRALEPALRGAARFGDYEKAKHLTAEIQEVLRPTGHEMRLMQAKNWFFEAAMEAGHLEIATAGLTGIRQKSGKTTRTYLEATALLAICHLRRGQIDNAEPLIAEALKSDANIASERRRAQFRIPTIQRLRKRPHFLPFAVRHFGH